MKNSRKIKKRFLALLGCAALGAVLAPAALAAVSCSTSWGSSRSVQIRGSVTPTGTPWAIVRATRSGWAAASWAGR